MVWIENITLPPHDTEAEMSVLYSIIVKNSLLHEYIIQGIRPEDFYARKHQVVYWAMLELKKNIDVITLANKLGYENGSPEQDYMFTLATYWIVPDHSLPHGKIVKEKAILRHSIQQATFIKNMCLEEQSIGDIHNEIKKLSDTVTIKEAPKDYETIVTEVYQSFLDDETKSTTTSGYWALDEILWWWYTPGQLVIVAARPWVGKTTFMMNQAIRISQAKKKVGFLSLEMANSEIIKRLICTIAGLSFYNLKVPYGEMKESIQKALEKSTDKVMRLDMFLVDDQYYLEQIISSCKNKIINDGLDCVFIDYLQIMKCFGKYSNNNDRVGYLTRELKLLAKEMKTTIIVGSQLSREIEKRRDPEPKLSDLRDSGNIEQDADIIMFLDKEELWDTKNWKDLAEFNVIVAKHRNGKIGDVKFELHQPSFNIYEIDEEKTKEPKKSVVVTEKDMAEVANMDDLYDDMFDG